MKIHIKNPFHLPLLIAGLGLLISNKVMAQPYTFGSEGQSTNTASITYNSGTGTFQYTNAANLSYDDAYLPLAGTAATFITTSNGWTATLAVNLSARSMTASSTVSPDNELGLGIVNTLNQKQMVLFTLDQANNTGGASTNIPNGVYGASAMFVAKKDVTTPLGSSVSFNGVSYLALSGGTNTPAATKSISAVTGVLTLTFNAASATLTGYYNGTNVASYSLTNWGKTHR